MTIKEVFEILNIKLPKKLISRQNEVAEVVSGFLPHVISRTGIFFDINPEPVNIASIKRALEKNTRQGDIILLKGIFRLGLVGAIDMAFGTSFIYDIFYFYNNSKIVSDDFFTGRVIKTIEKIDSTKCINMTAEQLIIPDSIDGYDVVHLKKGLCKGAKSKNIKLGKKLKNISSLAFSNCSNLLKIKIPGNIRLIDDKAFYNCSSLEVVKIKNGVLQINSKAFSKCSNLKKVYLPKSVIEIADDAFPHRKSIKFVTFRGSYARNYINDRYNRKGVISRIIRKIKRIIKSKVYMELLWS